MSIKEQIRAEIERQRQFIEGIFTEGDNSFYDGQDDAYHHILAYLDTLPEQAEPTIMTNEMLMGEIKPKKKSNALFDKCVENCDPAVMKEVSDNVDKILAREGLEEFRKEVIKFSRDHFEELYGDMETIDIVHIIARHFAEWGRAKMLEWAKEIKEQVSIGLNAYDMGEENGKAEMLNKLIEKIQSL